jgi:hypothetical protein
MGYLNNSVITVDAILTTKGRQLMATNDGSFKITQFALSDDEIDYTLYNPNHPSGSAYYGEAITSMPLLEAFPLETQMMKYKLVTLPRGTAKLPILNIGVNLITVPQNISYTISPQTQNYNSQVEPSGYMFTISDSRLVSSFVAVGVPNVPTGSMNAGGTMTMGTNVSMTAIGTTLTLRGTSLNTLYPSGSSVGSTINGTITIVGRDSGARITVPIQISKVASGN